MRYPLLVLFSLLVYSVMAQTKLISHKSHSGTNASFKISYSGLGLGEAPREFVQTAVLDSVIYVSESTSIMVTSEYCKTFPRNYKGEPTAEQRLEGATLWKAGRDTLHYHDLFSKKHKLDSIKAVIDGMYYFNNSSDKVVFVGYDNKVPEKKVKKKKKSEILPVIIQDTQQPPFDYTLLLSVGAIALFSILTGVLSWKLYQAKLMLQKI